MIETLAQLGEKEILNRLKNFMPLRQADDDTAEIQCFKKELLINTDVMVEGIHFSEKTTSPQDIGWKGIAMNFSDLAASGVNEILGVSIGLIAPPETPWRWVEGVYEGMDKALRTYGGEILGGDCSNGKEKVLSITALGNRGPLNLHRSNALPGDKLVTSGAHGLSRLGLGLLLSEHLAIEKTKNLPASFQIEAIRSHQRPEPPLKALRSLLNCKPKGIPWRAAATDSSDGLLEAINNLCISSNCQAFIDPEKLPKCDNWPNGPELDDWCLKGGEDFELIVSLPPQWAESWLNNFKGSFEIGTIEKGFPDLKWKDGKSIKSNFSDFNHFNKNNI